MSTNIQEYKTPKEHQKQSSPIISTGQLTQSNLFPSEFRTEEESQDSKLLRQKDVQVNEYYYDTPIKQQNESKKQIKQHLNESNSISNSSNFQSQQLDINKCCELEKIVFNKQGDYNNDNSQLLSSNFPLFLNHDNFRNSLDENPKQPLKDKEKNNQEQLIQKQNNCLQKQKILPDSQKQDEEQMEPCSNIISSNIFTNKQVKQYKLQQFIKNNQVQSSNSSNQRMPLQEVQLLQKNSVNSNQSQENVQQQYILQQIWPQQKNSDSIETQNYQQQKSQQSIDVQQLQNPVRNNVNQYNIFCSQKQAIYWNNNFNPPNMSPNFVLNQKDLNISSIHFVQHKQQQQFQQQQQSCFMSESFSLVSMSSNASITSQGVNLQSQELADLFLKNLFYNSNEDCNKKMIQKTQNYNCLPQLEMKDIQQNSYQQQQSNNNIIQQQQQQQTQNDSDVQQQNMVIQNQRSKEVEFQQQQEQTAQIESLDSRKFMQNVYSSLFTTQFKKQQQESEELPQNNQDPTANNNQILSSVSSNSMVSMSSGSDKENIIPLFIKKMQNEITGFHPNRKLQIKVELGNSFLQVQPSKNCYEFPFQITLTDKYSDTTVPQTTLCRSSIDFLIIIDNKINYWLQNRFFQNIFSQMLDSDRLAIIENDLKLQPDFIQANKEIRECIIEQIPYNLGNEDDVNLDLLKALTIGIQTLQQRKIKNLVTAVIIFVNEDQSFLKQPETISKLLLQLEKHQQNTFFYSLTNNQNLFWDLNQLVPVVHPFYMFGKERNIEKTVNLIVNEVKSTLIQNIVIHIQLLSECENDSLILASEQTKVTQHNQKYYTLQLKAIQMNSPKIVLIASMLKLGEEVNIQSKNNSNYLSSLQLAVKVFYQTYIQDKCRNFVCEPVHTFCEQTDVLKIPIVFQRENNHLITSNNVYLRAFLNQIGECLLQNEQIDNDCLCYYVKLFSEKKEKKEAKQFNAILKKIRQYYISQNSEAIQTLGNFLIYGFQTWIQKIF